MKLASDSAAYRLHEDLRDACHIARTFQDEQTGAIIGASIEVHTKMGRGFLESVYPECLAIEFLRRGIPFAREVALSVSSVGFALPRRLHLLRVGDRGSRGTLRALSSRDGSADELFTRIRFEEGLLLNFGAGTLETRRVVWGLEADPLKDRT